MRRTARSNALASAKDNHMSGRWELNPVCLLPKQVYYRYTTARLRLADARILAHPAVQFRLYFLPSQR